ncbi:hypothetical protein JYE83_001625 [Campylobacter upsaliensis]|uniref:Uncharacterized protein n=1 Tax=Campylobacter upsaliensis TaxID=28080 RepID=A0A5L4U8N2_CAMUP|nr:hypothetical protein [Campylobacter upsaliensis]EAI1478455.1 hypothetical protein [Campylobacter jejuni]EAH5677267.1 hypothetical protein [Campylobacter upsaliensis]EAH6026489.1 hypothetical protein [Campylobacter upsaliensis]EAH6029771.1 hypothetical protein [Campylobacter upsaliensis]
MINFSNANYRFHPCMPKECHKIYDTLKLMEKQEKKEKDELKISNEKQEISTLGFQNNLSILA